MDKISNKKTNGNFANTVLADAVFRPILFSTPMVQAILDGRKTQTRRIIKSQPTKQISFAGTLKKYWSENVSDLKLPYFQAKYQIGDILWVRETFAKMFDIHEELVGKDREDMGYWYKTDGELSEANFYIEGHKWKPSIFMPKEACRIFLEVTDVRVERLQAISEEDAVREGVEIIHLAETHVPIYRNYLIKEKLGTTNPKKSFRTLWESINGNQNWEENPWVWVYEFKRVDRPSGFC